MNTNVQLQLYEPIQQTDTVFSTILDNLYNDFEFKKNIARLESGQEKDIKKAIIIKNTVNKLKIYGSSDKPLLLARDVGILMGISNIRQQVKYYNLNEKLVGLCKAGNGKLMKVEYLTWKGVIRAASNSRSILSELFREFIYELVAQVTKNPELLTSVIKNVVNNNPELVKEAKKEYQQNVEYYKKLYQNEIIKTKLLQLEYEEETQKRLISENQVAEKELMIAFQEIKIRELKKYTNYYEEIINNIVEDNNETELILLKQRFMKPLHIYVMKPIFYLNLLKKADANIKKFLEYAPNYPDYINYFEAKKNNDKPIKMIPDEYGYFYLHFGNLNNDDFIQIATEWVLDKKHYDAVISEMNNECENIFVKKTKIIYYTNLDEISDIIKLKFININLKNGKS